MESDVLKNTGGQPILLTVEKTGEFRISVTNLGLKDKIALTIRSWNKTSGSSPTTDFMTDLDRLWTIQKVESSVTNDPPCG